MLRPFHYHQQIAAHLKKQTQLWTFFSTDAAQVADFKQFKTELLKNTYRLEPEAEPAIYTAVDKAKAVLQVSQTVTVYQLLESTDLNASVFVQPEEVHIVLYGGVIKLLDAAEMEAVIAHELGHVRFFAEDGGDYLIADRMLGALTAGTAAPTEYFESARLFDLYTELYCDQMALRVTGDMLPVVSSLVKLNTGLERVSGESYLRQATEIFGSGTVQSENITHPENFIRAYAIQLFQTAPEQYEEAMADIIQGQYKLRELDIFSREALQLFTRKIIAAMLADKELQTETLLNLAKQYFPDFQPLKKEDALPEAAAAAHFDDSTKEYIAYVLLDFAMADKEVESEAYARAHAIATALCMAPALKEITKKEGKLSEKKYNERYKHISASHA